MWQNAMIVISSLQQMTKEGRSSRGIDVVNVVVTLIALAIGIGFIITVLWEVK